MKLKPSPAPKVALALSDGGPSAAIYEIGALCALAESLNGIDSTKRQDIMDDLGHTVMFASRRKIPSW
jgi:hypothetical protein